MYLHFVCMNGMEHVTNYCIIASACTDDKKAYVLFSSLCSDMGMGIVINQTFDKANVRFTIGYMCVTISCAKVFLFMFCINNKKNS